MKVKNFIITMLSLVVKIVIVIVAVTYIAKGAVKTYNYGYSVFEDKPFESAPGRDIQVTIPEGSGPKEIGKILHDKGVIGDPTLFWIQNLLSSYKDELKAGTYTLNSSMSAEEIMQELAGVEEPTEEELAEGAGVDA